MGFKSGAAHFLRKNRNQVNKEKRDFSPWFGFSNLVLKKSNLVRELVQFSNIFESELFAGN